MAERAAVYERLRAMTGSSTTDRNEVARRLGTLSKAIEKVVWDAISVRDLEAPSVKDRNGRPAADPDLRDNENVPLPGPTNGFDEDATARLGTPPYREAVERYVAAEIDPYVPDVWVDHTKTKVGYEIPLTRQFYRYVPPRPLEEIDAEIRDLEVRIQRLLAEVAG